MVQLGITANAMLVINNKVKIMKKQILNLGKALNKVEQKEINGGSPTWCQADNQCGSSQWCCQGVCRTRSQVAPGTCPSMDGDQIEVPSNPCEDMLDGFELNFSGCL